MSLYKKLREDLKHSMKHGTYTKQVIRQIFAEFWRLTVPVVMTTGKKTTRPKTPSEITDADIEGIITGLIKSEIATLHYIDRETSSYLVVLQSYMPETVDEDEVKEWIILNVDFTKFKNKMQAIGVVKAHFGNKADSKMVSALIKEWKI